MKFSEVTGQDSLKAQLADSVVRGRISHAQLLLGREGSGNLALALALAQFINCNQRQGLDSCGECNSCRKAAKFTHPDIHFTYPVVTGNDITNPTSADYAKEWREALQVNPYMNVQDWIAQITDENKQGNINVSECNRIIKIFDLMAFEGLYKILIIWMPEYLDKAGNKILKLLEEPPENSLFLLVANNEEGIINTILSRTQITRVPPIDDKTVSQYIKGRFEMGNDECMHIAQMAEGNLREAILLAGHVENPYKDIWVQYLNACATGNPVLINTFVDQCSKLNREGLKSFFKFGLQFLHECLMLAITGACKLSASDAPMAEKVNKLLNLDQLEYIVRLLEHGIYHRERNANVRIELMHIAQHTHLMFKGSMPADALSVWN